MKYIKISRGKISISVSLAIFIFCKGGYCETFNTSILFGNSKTADLSRLLKDNTIIDGEYGMNVYVNDIWKGFYQVDISQSGKEFLISEGDGKNLGIDMSDVAMNKFKKYSLISLSHKGKVLMDLDRLKINIVTPQRYVIKDDEDYISYKAWSSGIAGVNIGYNISYFSAKNKYSSENSNTYGLFNSLISLGSLGQFKDNSTLMKEIKNNSSGDNGFKYENNTRYYQYHLNKMKSNLQLGRFFSAGLVLEQTKVKGVTLSSDEDMKPDSQSQYAPVIRGIANSNALVQVHQGNSIIYQENVPPGEFSFKNIQPTGLGGDLLVIVKESTGNTHSFTVPFSTVPGLLKEDNYNYSVTAGELDERYLKNKPKFINSEIRYGINNTYTLYGGAILNSGYKSIAIGSGINTSVGALSFDVTQSNAHFNGSSKSGQSIRFLYSKYFNPTETNFTLAAYRYSTKNFLSFNDYAYLGGVNEIPDNINNKEITLFQNDSILNRRAKNTFSANINQRLCDNYGTLSFSGVFRDYWDGNTDSKEFNLGYSNNYKDISYNIYVTRDFRRTSYSNSSNKQNTSYFAGITIPFSIFDKKIYTSSSVSADESGYNNSTLSVSGTTLDGDRLSYSVSATDQKQREKMYSTNLSYRSDIATLGSSVSSGGGYHQYGLSASGSVAIIPWNVLMANEFSNTVVIAKAPKAGNLIVNSDESIKTNSNGLALIPYSRPYRRNTITLYQNNNSYGAVVLNNTANIAPEEGTINILEFKTDTKNTWHINATDSRNNPLPFGSSIVDEDNNDVGYVGQSGIIYVHSDRLPKKINVLLAGGKCTINNPSTDVNKTNVCKTK